jgi:hypothetical protein
LLRCVWRCHVIDTIAKPIIFTNFGLIWVEKR